MGLIGKFVVEATGEIISNAYFSTYLSEIQFTQLNQMDERRQYYEGKKEIPKHYIEANGEDSIGKYQVQGFLHVFYNRKARTENKKEITKIYFRVCLEEPNNFHQKIYKYIKEKYPDLKNSDGEESEK